ncbi:EF-hand domain-containing protein [Roseibium polysiphoniae]|uniref:EF-hand domain-containing protein n=1 Tax=Roseibium polysiphoniae TaxID=2571221 RepID=UPI0025953C7F|nr:EF-hand domain-containing protein [uncultured Roseibium sp.]
MKPMKKIAIAALTAGVASVAITAVQAESPAPVKGQYAMNGGMGGDEMGRGMGHGRKGGRHQGRKFMERFDVNKDGVVNQAEVDEVVAKRFAEGDTDTSGAIDLAEFKAGFEEKTSRQRVRVFQHLDKDGDGTVTTEEFNDMTDRMFSRLDRDGNGELERMSGSRGGKPEQSKRMGHKDGERGPDQKAGKGKGPDGEEKGKGREARGPRHEMEKRGHEGRHGSKGGKGGMRGRMMENIFTMLDTNKDGKVTRAEFEDVRGKLFASADTDGSGGFELTDFSTIWMTMNEGRVVRMFQKLDADGDLSITAEEHAKRSANLVERMDRNGDDVVTKADFNRGKKARHGKGHHDHEGRKQRG